MDREQYLTRLRNQNGYCNCPQQQPLFDKRREASALEAKCDFMKQNVDAEDPSSQDREFLEDYQRLATQLNEVSTQYHSMLTQSINAGRANLTLHDTLRAQPLRKIRTDEARELLSTGAIITINCGTCNQQVDIVQYL